MKIKLTKTDREKVEAFADERMGSSGLYESRGGFKRADLIAGALGEIAAYKVLKKAGHELRKPDFTIYEKGRKSYDADLQIKTGTHVKNFHVKSQTKASEKLYGPSWLLQRYDPLFKGTGYNNYIVPSVVDLDTNTVELFGIFPVATVLNKDLVGECKVPHFRRTKVALYFKDLDEGITKADRWRVLRDVAPKGAVDLKRSINER